MAKRNQIQPISDGRLDWASASASATGDDLQKEAVNDRHCSVPSANSLRKPRAGSHGTFMSITSTSSATEQRIITQAQKDRRLQLTQMVVVLAIPLVALVTLSLLDVSQAVGHRVESRNALDALQSLLYLDKIISRIQAERGLSAASLSNAGFDPESFQKLEKLRSQTDKALDSVSGWTDRLMVAGVTLPLSELHTYLSKVRSKVDSHAIEFEESILLFTEVTKQLLDITRMKANVAGSNRENLWKSFLSAIGLFMAAEAAGIQRALGSAFYIQCNLVDANAIWFNKLEGEAESSLGLAFLYYPTAEKLYNQRYSNSQSMLQRNITTRKLLIVRPGDEEEKACLSDDTLARLDDSKMWFDYMTSYLSLLQEMRFIVLRDITRRLEGFLDEATSAMTIHACIITAVILVCSGSGVWYLKNVNHMTNKIAHFADNINRKSRECSIEKKRTELLLYQMLPKAVTNQLKNKKEVPAENYDCVTICFSDIADFSHLSANSSPMQIIDLLNELFSTFDRTIEEFAVYKVETIGESYMLVSGLPDRTSDHAYEICDLAVELMLVTNGLTIGYLPDTRLQLRIGIHTGQCVAGVVGLKMPRYCLFGDTVNTASRLMSNGLPYKIQISENTFRQLAIKQDLFIIEERGIIKVKGKEPIRTFWVIGRTFSGRVLNSN